MSIVSRLARIAVVPVVAGALFVACGSEPGTLSQEEAQQLIDALPERAADEPFRFEIRQTFEGLDGIEVDPEAGLILDPALFSVLAEGGIDVPEARSWLHFEIAGASMDLVALFEASEDFDLTPGNELGTEPIPFTVDLIQDGDTSYTRFPFFTAFFGVDPDKWVTAEAEGAEDDLLGLETFVFTPEQLTEYLAAVEGDLEIVGDEEIRGAETTHVRASIALDAIDDEDFFFAPPPDGDAGAVPVDVWIDGEGRLHKLEFTQPVDVSDDDFLPLAEGSEPPGEVTATFSLWLFDYGEPIELTIPGPDEVVDEEELWGGFGFDEGEFTWTEDDQAFADLWNALEYNLTLEDRELLEADHPELHEEYLALEEAWYFAEGSVTAEDVAALEDLVARMSAALGHDLAAEPDYGDGEPLEWTPEEEEYFDLRMAVWAGLTDEDWDLLYSDFPDVVEAFWALDEATWDRPVTTDDIDTLRDIIARIEAAVGKDLGIE